MDSKVVSKGIRAEIHPVLKTDGFSKFTGRNAWRFDEDTISIVEFQSFNSYLADGVGCTTFSFTLRLGLFYRCRSPSLELPKEPDCTFRFVVGKTLRQRCFVPYASVGGTRTTDRADVFYVAADGSNLNEVLADARAGLVERGLPTLEQYRDASFAYRALFERDSMEALHGTMGVSMPGNFDAPWWRDTVIDLGHLSGVADPRKDIWEAQAKRRGATHDQE